MDKKIAIGIDLGWTNSYVGVFCYGKIEIIANDQGDRATPSYVAFTDRERLVGAAAKRQAPINIENTVFGIKRFIGRRFDDELIQKDIEHYPFNIVNHNGILKISVEYKGENVIFHPEEISAMVLSKIKQIAEEYLGVEVIDAVITVPTSFNNSQRQATKDAAKIAGLNVMRLIDEPIAAIIAYGLEKKSIYEDNILIFDLGDSTLNVSILNFEDGILKVKATSGDAHLGGEDFDSILVDYCAEEFLKKRGKDMRGNKYALQRLRTACELAKHSLFTSEQSHIEVEELLVGAYFTITLTRAKFEELCDDLFKSTLKSVDKALADARMEKEAIHDIVLVGEPTRMPKIRRLLGEYFNGKEILHSIRPEEVVAYGAAIQAKVFQDLLLLDVTPFSLGIQTMGGQMTTLIPRNNTIPIRETKIFSTSTDDQTKMLIKVFAGERTMTKDNIILGQFRLYGIPKSARGVPQIEVTFDIDVNRLLTVSVIEKSSGNTSKIEIQYEKNRRLTNDKIYRIFKKNNHYGDYLKHSTNEILLIDDDIYDQNSPLSQFENFIECSFSKIELLLAKSPSTNIVYNLENAKNVLLNTNSNATIGNVSFVDQSNSEVAALQVSIMAIQEFMSKYIDRTDATQQTLFKTLTENSVNSSKSESTEQSTEPSKISVDEKNSSLKSDQLGNQNAFEDEIQEFLKVLIEKTKIINESKTNKFYSSTNDNQEISIEQNQLNLSENETTELTEESEMKVCFEKDIIETDSQTPDATIGKTSEMLEMVLNANVEIELIKENLKIHENQTTEAEELVKLEIAAKESTVSDSDNKLKTQLENKVFNVVLVCALIGLAGYYIVKRIRFV